jgi:nicotinamide riboside kinase
MLLINFTGGPGSGKSTMAAGLFHRLKTRKWNVELVTEYTKELILTDDTWSLSDELVVFSEKYRRIKKLERVDIVITDSALVNSVVYGDTQFGPAAGAFYEAVARSFDSLYFAVTRVVPYVPLGRMPDEDEAEKSGRTILSHVERMGEPMWEVQGNDEGLPGLVRLVEKEASRREFSRFGELMDDSLGLKDESLGYQPRPLTLKARDLSDV